MYLTFWLVAAAFSVSNFIRHTLSIIGTDSSYDTDPKTFNSNLMYQITAAQIITYSAFLAIIYQY